jgi:CRP-like cAMP-binding protein
MREMLALSEGLPVREVEAGHVLVREGERSGALYVLERGALTVARGGVTIAAITVPGSLVGEIAVLVGCDHSATVTATIPSAVRVADDGEAFLRSSPEVTLLVAKEVAQRLQRLVAYVADLKTQDEVGPGLDVVDEILAQLSAWRAEALEDGMELEPDPDLAPHPQR